MDPGRTDALDPPPQASGAPTAAPAAATSAAAPAGAPRQLDQLCRELQNQKGKLEAEKAEQILKAEGEANAIIAVAEAKAEALHKVGAAANTEDGQKAVQLDLAEQAITAKEAIARESSVVLLSDSNTNAANVVAEAMTIVNRLNQSNEKANDNA